MTVARYLTEAYKRYGSSGQRLKIVEAGAGTGSAAESILYFFSNFEHELLPLVDYSIVEISPSLCKRIDQKLSKSYRSLLRNGQLKILNEDISNYKES